MQQARPCSHQCVSSAGLASRSLIAGGTWPMPPPTSKRYIITTICGAVNKKGPSGGESQGKPAGSLAKSLLRDVMAVINSVTTNVSSGTGSFSASSRPVAGASTLPEDLRSASYGIAATNTVLFFTSALVPLLPVATLLLNHQQPQPWQLITSSFAHPSLESLMLCVFFTYIFGRVVERNHGLLATWVVYISCGAAAAALAWWMLPSKALLLSSAAPAAAWGLFLVGVGLPRLVKKPLEVACLLPFTFAATVSRYSPLAGLMVYDGMSQGQLIHVAGASVAAMLAVFVLALVAGWQAEAQRKQREAKRQETAAREEEAINAMINAASQAAVQIGKKLL